MNRNYYIFFLVFITLCFNLTNLSGQKSITLKFTSNHNNKYIPLDSFKLINVTQGDTSMFYWPDTTVTLNLSLGINGNLEKKHGLLSQNYPNPFNERTNIDVYLQKAGPVNIHVTDITGKLITQYNQVLNSGAHSFSFEPDRGKVYFLSVKTNNDQRTIKMVCLGNSLRSKAQLIYSGTKSSSYALKSTNTALPYKSGDALKYISYTTSGEIYNDTVVDTPTGNKNYLFETAWEFYNNPLKGIDKVYNCLYFDGLYKRMYPLIMDVRADDVETASPWVIYPIENYTYIPDNILYEMPWTVIYTGIYRANQVLEYVPSITMDESLKARILGEAHFLRGLFYYNFLNLYKEGPLNISLAKKAVDFIPAKTPRNDIWANVISDFAAAKAALPIKQAANDSLRPTKGAAAGFLGKTYMIMHQWTDASNILKEIIDLGTYSLVPNYRDNFTTKNEHNSESLFEIVFSKKIGGNYVQWLPGTTAQEDTMSRTTAKAIVYAPSPFGWGDAYPSNWIYHEFLLENTMDGKSDPRLGTSMFFTGNDTNMYGDKNARVNQLTFGVNSEHVALRKYLNDDTRTNEFDMQSEINERVLRYADIVLLYAEALNELGRTNEAYPYINMVRSRANLISLSPGKTQAQMRDCLAHERALEFCFEGQRMVDILRWGWPDDATQLNVLKTHDPHYNSYTTGHQFLPIPQSALKSNKNLTQESGW